MVGAGVFVASNFVTLQCLFFYIILSYPEYAASLLAANDFLRATLAAGFLHAGTPMFTTLGLAGGGSLLAGLVAVLCPGIYCLYRFGDRLRARSKFATSD
jgi:DHA1 family multidrug resistance protein-like MFS transporter